MTPNDEYGKALNDLQEAEKLQDIMKKANAIIRSKKNVIERLVSEAGLSETNAIAIQKPDFAGRIGFPAYKLTNNNANIKRLQDRVNMLSNKLDSAKKGNETYTFTELGGGGKIEINYDIDRVQLIFSNGRVDNELYKKLRSNGYVHSPTNKAFQRKITPQAISNAIYLTKATKVMSVNDADIEENTEISISDYSRMLETRNFTFATASFYDALPKEFTGVKRLEFVYFSLNREDVEAGIKKYLEANLVGVNIDKVSISQYPKTYVKEAKVLFSENRFLPTDMPPYLVLSPLYKQLQNFNAMQKDNRLVDVKTVTTDEIVKTLKSNSSLYFYIECQNFDEYQIWYDNNVFSLYSKKKNENKFHKESITAPHVVQLIGLIESRQKDIFGNNIIRNGINICGYKFSHNDNWASTHGDYNSIDSIIADFPEDEDEEALKDLQKYSSSNKYNSEIEVGQRYFDNRYQDYYTIEKMTEVVSGGDVSVTLKYDKGTTRTESGDFILYHIDQKQHSLSKEEAGSVVEGNNKLPFMLTEKEYIDNARLTDTYPIKDIIWERNQKGIYRREIEGSLKVDRRKVNGQYADIPSKFKTAIADGKISAKDAIKIIESAGLEVPKYILEQSLKESQPESVSVSDFKFGDTVIGNIGHYKGRIGKVDFISNDKSRIVVELENGATTGDTGANEWSKYEKEEIYSSFNDAFIDQIIENIKDELYADWQGDEPREREAKNSIWREINKINIREENKTNLLDAVYKKMYNKKDKEQTTEIINPNTHDEFDQAIMDNIDAPDDWIGNLIKERTVKQQIYKQLIGDEDEKKLETERIFHLYAEKQKNPNKQLHEMHRKEEKTEKPIDERDGRARLRQEIANAEKLMANPRFTGDVTNEINRMKEQLAELEGEGNSNSNGKIPAKFITLQIRDDRSEQQKYSDYDYDSANDKMRWLLDNKKFSNLNYDIEFEDGETLGGVIDCEPREFFDNVSNPLTRHLNDFWGNVAKSKGAFVGAEEAEQAKDLIEKYDLGESKATEPEIKKSEPAVLSLPILELINYLNKEDDAKKKAEMWNEKRSLLLTGTGTTLWQTVIGVPYIEVVNSGKESRVHFSGNDLLRAIAKKYKEFDIEFDQYIDFSKFDYDKLEDIKTDSEKWADRLLHYKNILRNIDRYPDYSKKNVEQIILELENKIGQKPKSDYQKEVDRQIKAGEIEDDSKGISITHLAKNIEQSKPFGLTTIEYLDGGKTVTWGTKTRRGRETVIGKSNSDINDEIESLKEYIVIGEIEQKKAQEQYDKVKGMGSPTMYKSVADALSNLKMIERTLYVNKNILLPFFEKNLIQEQPKDEIGDVTALTDAQLEKYLDMLKIKDVSRALPNAQEAKIAIENEIKKRSTSNSTSDFKGVHYDYKNQYVLNKAIEELLSTKDDNFTSEEKIFMRKYSGYGGLDKYGKTGKGGLFEFYTPSEIIERMWGLAYKYGYNNGSVLETSVGTGEFLKYAPKDARIVGYEISEYSAKICKILYPTAEIHLQPFEKLFIKNNYTMKAKIESLEKFSLVIGNPPYGDFSTVESRYMSGMGEKDYTSARNYVEYFIRRGVDLLESGGLLVFIVGSQLKAGGKMFLDGDMTPVKEWLAENCTLETAYRLPDSVFERTGVTADIIVLKKN